MKILIFLLSFILIMGIVGVIATIIDDSDYDSYDDDYYWYD